MSLTPKERQSLLAASHALKPVVVLKAGAVPPAAVEQVRRSFAHHELIKVRVNADSGGECDATGADLAAQVPCELVKRIGRIVLLYRRVQEDGAEE
jgi:RNA-binding protein